MPTDPNIILGINQDPGIQPGQLVSMFDFAQQVRQVRQQEASQNALKSVFSDPNSVDPATGLPNAQAIRKVMQVDPGMGIKLQDASLEAQVKKAQLIHNQTEQGKTKFDFMSQVAGAGVDAYQDAKTAGKPEADAIAAGQAARNAAAKNGGGLVGDDVVDGITGSPFDPAGARALASTNKDWSEQRDKKASLVRQDAAEKERERHDSVLEANTQRGQNIRVETGENNKWQVLHDSKANVDYRYNPDTAQATTLDGKPYAPQGASKMGSGGDVFTPEMGDLGAALAEKGVSLPAGMRSKSQQMSLYKGLLDRNKDKSPDEIATLIKTGQIEFGAQKKETQTAAGVAGKVEVAANELNKFVPLVRKASADLKRGNFTDLNSLVQTADTHISDPKLKTLKGYIVGTLNAYDMLAARGGTDAKKRAENRKQLLSAEGDGAINAALDVILKESEIAHQSSVEATRVPELDNGTKNPPAAAKIAAPTSKAEYDSLPKGAHYSKPGDAPGTFRVKQ